jgi:DNA-binding response OmpR family regulator
VEEIPEVTPAAASGKSILVVDDDIEVTQYLKDLLSADYEVLCKFNAASALESLGEKPVDLVISDVSMPGKDGYALCQDIKSDSQLCHIPVILVTAKVTVENQIQGLDMGADAYVTKPFDPYYLKSLIRSQLDNRDRMQSLVRMATSTQAIAPSASLSAQDSDFLDNLYKLNRAAELIKEGKYTISQISDLTGFSSPSKFSTLFKKQFGVPPSSYKG